jgi:four helix bundle protein
MQDDLEVWQASAELTVAVYRASARFPRAERFGLTSQIRRGAVSISANIAEGCGRPGMRELAHFLSVASGSAHELESNLHVAARLGFLEAADQRRLAAELSSIKRMLAKLRQRVELGFSSDRQP